MTEEFPSNSLLLFYATSTEEEQLEKEAKEIGLIFRRQTHPKIGKCRRLGAVGDFEVIAVRTEMGPLTYNGSASKGIFWKIATSATAIVQIGMAFGVDPKNQNHGDVLVSSSLLPYDRKKAIAHEGHYRFDYTDAGLERARGSMLELFLKASERTNWPFKIHVGAVLSGGTAIRSSKFRDYLVSAFPSLPEPIVGGEMEAVGLVSVSPSNDPAWIVVKGISDFAEDTRDKEFKRTRELACRNSAKFALSALITKTQV